MTASPLAPFFLPGGTLPLNAPSYIRRRADDELFALLRQGEFCYILSSRQMGKSSLMVHVGARLQETGVRVAILDLNSIGHEDVTREQWYFSLALQLGERVGMESEAEEHWLKCRQTTPLQKWLATLRHLLHSSAAPLVVFIDEIDQIRALPFATDDFFAAIRNSYNRRAHDPEFARLSFCLIGTALPCELIEDPRLTPFNVGARIELSDFSTAEVAALEPGLGRDRAVGTALLGRVYYWTGGHPFLTQRLCRIIRDVPSIVSGDDVDRVCSRLFFSAEVREQEDNLNFVADRLLRGSEDTPALLTLYRQVLRRGAVAESQNHRLIDVLLLSGIVRTEGRRMVVRNRIYATCFDLSWVREHMPDSEARRQAHAYRSGVIRASLVSAAIVSVFAALSLFALSASRSADLARRAATAALHHESHLLYDADIYRAGEAWNRNDAGLVDEILNETASYQDRAFEWTYLYALSHQNLVTLAGHDGAVLASAFSADGSAVTASDDGSVRFWDPGTGRLIHRITGPRDRITAIAMSGDGTRIAIGGRDGIATVCDAGTGRVLMPFHGQGGPVYSVAVSADGGSIATGYADGTADVWNISTGRRLVTLRRHNGPIFSIAFRNNGLSIVTGSNDGTAILWNIATGQQLQRFTGHTGGVTSVALRSEDTQIVTGSMDKTVRVWNARTGRCVGIFRGSKSPILSMAVSANGERIVTGGTDKTAVVWDGRTGFARRTLRGHGGSVLTVAISGDGKRIITGSADQTARVWDSCAPETSMHFRGHIGTVASLDVSRDGGRILSGGDDGTAILWDARSGAPLRTFAGHTDAVRAAVISSDGTRVVTGSSDGAARVWDARTGGLLNTLKGHQGIVYCVAISPDGARIATGSQDGKMIVWDARTGLQLLICDDHAGAVYSVAMSADGTRLLTANRNGTATLWDAKSGEIIGTLNGNGGIMASVAFAPDGKSAVTGSWDKTATIWNLSTRRPILTLHGQSGAVLSAMFSHHGNRIITGSEDGTVRVWDAETGRELITLCSRPTAITCAVVAPDDRWIAAAGLQPDIVSWHADARSR